MGRRRAAAVQIEGRRGAGGRNFDYSLADGRFSARQTGEKRPAGGMCWLAGGW